MWIIFVLIAVLILVIFIATYNSFIVLRNKSDEAFSTMDIYLKKRYDLIPNLVEAVKGYAKHEKETLEKVVQARNMAASSEGISERQKNEDMLSNTLKSLIAITENYPELKADGGFMNLQNQLQQIETDISQARKYYNAVVKTYNTKTELFPSNLFALILGFKKYPYFMINQGERENVEIKF
ncbi:MAG: LemA family protein [Eubacteriaceae bacterium]